MRVPANITSVTLPPYSPKSNPVEKLRQSLREHHWFNRVYRDYAAPKWVALDARRRGRRGAGGVETLCCCE